jgi:hypothetical protein
MTSMFHRPSIRDTLDCSLLGTDRPYRARQATIAAEYETQLTYDPTPQGPLSASVERYKAKQQERAEVEARKATRKAADELVLAYLRSGGKCTARGVYDGPARHLPAKQLSDTLSRLRRLDKIRWDRNKMVWLVTA